MITLKASINLNRFRIAILSLSIVAAAMLILPACSFAYNDRVELSLMGQSGDIGTPLGAIDVGFASLSLSYTRFFRDIVSDDSPYGAREFIQHPPWVGLMATGESAVARENYTGIEMTEVTGASDIGGMYYTRSEDRATGIGLVVHREDIDMDQKLGPLTLNSEDRSKGEGHLFIHQYLTRNVRVELEAVGTGYEAVNNKAEKQKYDQREFRLGASALLGGLWLSGIAGKGTRTWDDILIDYDDKVGSLDLEAGYYFLRSLGVFAYLSSESVKTDLDPVLGRDAKKETLSIAGLRVEYYPTEYLFFRADAMRAELKVEELPQNTTMSANGARLSMGVLF